MSNGKKVLVFGTTGELGSRVARCCVDAGHQVTGVSRGKTKLHRADLTGVEMLTGDKGDESFLQSFATERQFDVIIDIAPRIEHLELAYKYFAGKIEHYFLCSSTGTYAPLLYCPADEEHGSIAAGRGRRPQGWSNPEQADHEREHDGSEH